MSANEFSLQSLIGTEAAADPAFMFDGTPVSRAEFAAKLGTVLEEADGSLYRLELIRDGELMPDSKVSLLLTEADELTAILAAGRKSAASNRTSNIRHLT